jgi:hypothetical protein
VIAKALWDAADSLRDTADKLRKASRLAKDLESKEMLAIDSLADEILTDLAILECRLHYASNKAFHAQQNEPKSTSSGN